MDKNKRKKSIEEEVKNMFSNLIGSISEVSKMYVEPGDTILVSVKELSDSAKAENMRKFFSQTFPGNKVIIFDESIKSIKVIKEEVNG